MYKCGQKDKMYAFQSKQKCICVDSALDFLSPVGAKVTDQGPMGAARVL